MSLPALAWVVFFLVAAELALRSWITWPNADISPPHYRNDFPYRGWPEYVSQREDHKDLILIGNSQGVGVEFSDRESIYAHRLYREIRRHDDELRLHNWSQTGVMTHQIGILTASALAGKPHALILVVSLTNFNKSAAGVLHRDATDVSLLLGTELMGTRWSGIPGLERSRTDDKLLTLFQSVSDIGRSRELLLDIAAGRVERRLHRFVFGVRRMQNTQRALKDRPVSVTRRINRPLQVPMTHDHWDRQFREQQYPVLENYYDWLQPRLRDAGTRLIWVWMPHGNLGREGAALSAMTPVKAEFCGRLRADGHSCTDLHGQMSAEDFAHDDISSHLSRSGHARMADLMMPVILDALH